MRRIVTAVVVAAAALGLTVQAASAGTDGSSSRAPLEYVALGDSYSAGGGVLPLDLSALACYRSLRNYPKVLAASVGATLTDATCSGATTANLSVSQSSGVAPQLDALRSTTRLVTMTIGVNDDKVFDNLTYGCSRAAVRALGQGTPCKDMFGTTFVDTIRTRTYPSLVKSLRLVRQRAPKAKIAITGYPMITPRTKGCFPILPIAQGDLGYFRDVQTTLNGAIKRAAAATGATYVDMTAVSEGHDACQEPSRRWIEPLIPASDLAIFHPNFRGEAAIAAQVVKVVGLR